MARSHILWRLFAAYGVLLTVSFLSLGWLLVGRMERHLLHEIQHDLEVKTLLIRNMTSGQPEADLPTLIARIAKDVSARVTIIKADGQVIADSDEQPAKMENHADR